MEHHSFVHKRRYKRRTLDMAAAVNCGRRHRFETAAEISEGGMLLKMKEPLRKGEIVEVQVILPNRRFIAAQGEVIYDLKIGNLLFVGIRFTKINSLSLEYIREYVAGS